MGMPLCVYVSVCVYVHADDECIYVCVCWRSCVQMCMFAHIYSDIYAYCSNVQIQKIQTRKIYMRTHTQTFACTSAHSHSYTRTLYTLHTHVRTHTNTYTHTHVVTLRYIYYETCTLADSSTFTCKQRSLTHISFSPT